MPARTLYVDTATSDQWLYREPSTDPRQPHMTRLAMMLVAGDAIAGDQSVEYCHLIMPNVHWVFGDFAVQANGVSRERALADGIALEAAMMELDALAHRADRLVAFNLDFHRRVLERSAGEANVNLFLPPDQVCAMRASTSIVRKPRPSGAGFAWPKQNEAYMFFTGHVLIPPSADPIERGLALVRAVRAIDEGIAEHA